MGGAEKGGLSRARDGSQMRAVEQNVERESGESRAMERDRENRAWVGAAGAQEGRAEGYRSPPGKLIKFFQQSRDRWKAKCRAAKARVKGLQTQLRSVEKSKASWKSRVQALERELARVQAAQHALADEVEALKKSA